MQKQDFILDHAKSSAAFLRLLVENIMLFRPPLNRHGSIDTENIDNVRTLDLDKYGCSVFVDVARFLSVVQGIDQVNTRRRFESVVNGFSLEQQKREAWVSAFEFLQMMRLRIQLDEGVAAPHVSDQPDLVNYDILDNIDKRILKECFRVGRKLQQRIESEYLS